MGARKHKCDVDMRRAYAIGVLDSIEDTLKVHMYLLNVPGFELGFCCLLFVVCCLMFVDYHNFLSFRFHWALLACLRWSLGTLGLPWVPLDCHPSGLHRGTSGALLGSICRLRGSIETPLGVIGAQCWIQLFIFREFEDICNRLHFG